ncbi:MAG: hypothetical protein JNK20_10315 [Flavipsychrobacter sp.]|nr:hypothetical protein [Flavipsychrobacter sp.]
MEKDLPVTAIRNRGEAIGSPSTFTISPNGGNYVVNNGLVKIEVPVGAAETGTQLTVQEISNTSPGSIGPAFRISTNKELNAPVSVNYSYRDLADSLSLNPECTLGMSLQDSSGVWWLQAGRSINIAQKYVSISIRGGDCALATPVKLTPVYSIVRPNTSVELAAIGTIHVVPQTDLCNLFRNGASSMAMTEEYLLDPGLVEKWEVLSRGPGTGTLHPEGGAAVYKTADYELPEINPVTILLFMTTSKKPLSAQVFVQPDVTGLSIWIGDKQYLFNDEMVDLGIDSDGSMGMSWEGPDGMGSMTWKQNATGTYSWNENNTIFLFEPTGISPQQAFQSFYNDGRTVSSGDIIITKAGSVGQKISGTLLIQEAGRTNTESGNGEYLGSSKLVGTFNLMRDY